ncbi:hypothetical protein Clacol_010372 [Clathrus columnatus]|uniref:Uncharacterized protein n=1 Tax=Clathrus columnatus TaxID=1419009 RepID=A0AAV5ATX9_9AGAM|nr:hypothetical protein Clacol_010372 [Clathrus columnatus]
MAKWIAGRGSFKYLEPEDDRSQTEQSVAKIGVTATETITVFATATVTSTKELEVISTIIPTPGPSFCDACGPDDSLCAEYGEHNLAKSRLYEGTNFRFHRVIKQALAGEPVKIGVLGGSVTKGHGLRTQSDNWTNKFLEAWKGLFPNSQTELYNGAVPATGSDYLSVCFGEHLDEDVDLVLIELAINDQRLESNANAYEWLLRGVLELPKRPAVINLQTMTLLFEQISMGGDLHIRFLRAILCIRNFLVPYILKHAELDEYYFCKNKEGTDWRHVDVHGHKVMADILIAYTQRQICAVEMGKSRLQKADLKINEQLPKMEDLDDIPRIRLLQKYDRDTVLEKFSPTCQSVRTTKHPLTPIENQGWTIWTFKGRLDKPYLVAKNPGDFVKFEVLVGTMRRVRITYLKSKTFGLGDVWCWLDDDRAKGTKVSGWWNKENLNIARQSYYFRVIVLSENAEPGKHTVTCEIMQETSDPGKGHEFRLIAVDAA